MTIDELFDLPERTPVSEKEWQLDNLVIPKDWSQGRTVFGGVSAGILCKALSPLVKPSHVLRSFTTQFVGPLTPGDAFSIQLEKLREGRNVSQFIAKIVQNGNICVLSQACYGVGRESSISVDNTHAHSMPVPTKAKFIPQIPKVTPKFLQHFDLSIDDGGLPFTKSKKDFYHGWMRFKKPPATIEDAHILTMIDAWPPTLLQLLRWPAPASTVSWNVEFIHPHRPVSGEDWFAYQVHTKQAAAGYGHTEATIWDKDNEVIALSRQTVAVFD